MNALTRLFNRNTEQRAFRLFNEASQIIPPVGYSTGWTSWGWISPSEAMSLPAVFAAVRLVAETIASFPLRVYRGERADKRIATDAWQYGLLHDAPAPELTAFDFLQDIVASVESCGNAFVRKIKIGSRVVELHALDPDTVHLYRDQDTGEKVFDVFTAGTPVRYSTAEILHVRGICWKAGAVSGVSPITQASGAVAVAMAQEQFVGRYFQNDARPGVALIFPGTLSEEQAQAQLDIWNAQHAGVRNAHRAAAIGGGGDVKVIPMSLNDAQLVQLRQFSSAQIAQLFRVPIEMMEAQTGGDGQRQTTEQEALNFLNFSLLPRLRRIENAFRADTDLFPGDGTYPQFFVDEFLRTDAKTRAEVQHFQVQDGTKLVDEVRAENGDGPLPDGAGQVPQLTPVGGAPNPNLNGAATPVAPSSE